MKRKDFIRKSILGTSLLSTGSAWSAITENDIDELRPLPVIGFNHLPHTNSKIMSNQVLHKANTRGHAHHGWLDSHHSFSFANYYNPERMHFGVLRVLNDDTIAPGTGFGTHPHDNMEIISIPLSGALEHKDSMGNKAVIRAGEIQVMSAGSGITHSEYNHSSSEPGSFLQIWLFPNKRNVNPRYDQIRLELDSKPNSLIQILSPNPDDEGVWIHQDAWFHMGRLDAGVSLEYKLRKSGNGVYAFVIGGEVTVDGTALNQRDGLGVWGTDQISIRADRATEILLMEVPMKI